MINGLRRYGNGFFGSKFKIDSRPNLKGMFEIEI